MPIYEYRCHDCGKTFEYMQRMTDEPKTTCESCGGSLERLISQSAFVLKGGGWYKDLYSSPKPAAESSSDSGGKGGEKKGEGKEAGGSGKDTGKGAGSGSGSGTGTKSGD